MVVSQNRGTPIQTLKYYSPHYRDPQKGTPNIGKPPSWDNGKENGSYFLGFRAYARWVESFEFRAFAEIGAPSCGWRKS